MLRKTVDPGASAHAAAGTVEHEDLETGIAETVSQGHVVLAGHIVPMGHDDKTVRRIFWFKKKSIQVCADVGAAGEVFMLQTGMFIEVVQYETRWISHPYVESPLIDLIRNKGRSEDERYYYDYCDQYVFHAVIIL